MHRRRWILSLLGTVAALSVRKVPAQDPANPAPLAFPRDFGAHPETRIEWWYATGALQAATRRYGFQITFFRAATGIAERHPSRFAANQLVFAHAALSDLDQRRLRHDERIARSGFGIAEAAVGDTDVVLRDWRFRREGIGDRSRYVARMPATGAGFGFDLALETTQPVLLQGIGGLSRKGPRPEQSSRYYSQPQLAVAGTLSVDGVVDAGHRPRLARPRVERRIPRCRRGRLGLDRHEPRRRLGPDRVPPAPARRQRAVRRRQLSAARRCGPRLRTVRGDVRGRVAAGPAARRRRPTRSNGPIDTPVGRYAVKALLDSQELDSRASTGAIYWEGLSDLFDASGQRVGGGYLEMTGYASALTL